jgi:NAD-reducing hydrogenase large subunit
MDRSVLEVAKKYVKGKAIKEEALNRVEAAIRCYDPCLSCSTHALGQMPMKLEVVDHKGNLMNVIQRG